MLRGCSAVSKNIRKYANIKTRESSVIGHTVKIILYCGKGFRFVPAVYLKEEEWQNLRQLADRSAAS